MSTQPARLDQLSSYPEFRSLTPRGWSLESKEIRDAEVIAFEEYHHIPVSLLHLGASDDYQVILRMAFHDLSNILDAYRDRIPEDKCDRIRKRLEVLIDPAAYDIEDNLPDLESFRKLLSFLAENEDLRQPSIFLNRYGLFTASWRPEKRKLASLVFHPDEFVNWLVFVPRKDDDTDVIEAAGRAPVDIVLGEVEKHGALTWMRRQD